jgi:hypothetical protein
MLARTDALMSRAETGKMSAASIVPVVSGCHPTVPISTSLRRLGSTIVRTLVHRLQGDSLAMRFTPDRRDWTLKLYADNACRRISLGELLQRSDVAS